MVDEFIKLCEENNYTFLLSNTYCWGLKLKEASYDGDYVWYEKAGDYDLEKLINKGTDFIKNRNIPWDEWE
jgi:hypothetical protein